MKSAGQCRYFTPEPFDNHTRLRANGGIQQNIDSGFCYVHNFSPAQIRYAYHGKPVSKTFGDAARRMKGQWLDNITTNRETPLAVIYWYFSRGPTVAMYPS